MCRIRNVTYRKSIIGNVTDPPPIPPQSSFFQVISADILYIFKFELYPNIVNILGYIGQIFIKR